MLITGGAGFIGSNFAHHLASRGEGPVVVLDKLTYAGNAANLAPLMAQNRLRLEIGDIADRPRVRALLAEVRPRCVAHFAAESHVDRSIAGPEAFVATNVMGTLCLLDEVRDYWATLPPAERSRFRFLHVSTDEVYGSLTRDEAPFTESSRYAPNSPYAASKAGSDHLVRSFHHTYGLPTLISNCSNNYGPYQFPEKLIPLMIGQALAGYPLPVYGDGQQVRDWLFVEDHCTALMCLIEQGRPGQVYNVGGGAERRNLEVVQAICQRLDELRPGPNGSYAQQIQFVADRPGHDFRYAIDAGKLRRETGWVPTVSFEEGLARTIDWYLQHEAWSEQVRTGAYRRWLAQQYGSSSAP